MTVTVRSLACLLLFPLSLAAADNIVPPEITHRVDPEYSLELQKVYLPVRTKIDIVVDPEGKPFSLAATPPIPQSVVEAVAKWRFKPGTQNGTRTAFRVSVVIPVRVSITRAVELGLQRRWFPTKPETADIVKAASMLDSASAAEGEKTVAAQPLDWQTRSKLIVYYSSLAGATTENRTARSNHILWLVKNQPEADILGSAYASLPGADNPLFDEASIAEWKRSWAALPQPVDVTPEVRNATNFLRIADPVAAERLLSPLVPQFDAAAVLLGDVYAVAGLGIRGVDLKSGHATAADAALPADEFSERSRSTLLTTQDIRLLLTGLNTVALEGRSLAKAGHLPAGYDTFCAALLQRGRSLYPETGASCDTTIEVRDQSGQMRIGGNVMEAHLVKKVQPNYPAEAKQRGIQGVVEFAAIIGPDGKIEDLKLVKAPLALYRESRDAVRQWEYRPTLLNGQPVSVITNLVVNFTLHQ
jgi:TonB family protein